MVAGNKFNDTVDQVGLAKHDFSAAGHVFKAMLTNTAPVAANALKADLTEITPENGYVAGGDDIQNTWVESGGTATLDGTDVVFQASGGTIGPFRYLAIYNDTQATPAKPLFLWYDHGTSITLQDGETFTYSITTNIATLS